MVTGLVLRAFLGQALIQAPPELGGETTLRELSAILKERNGLEIKLDADIADRPIFFYWEPSEETALLEGIAYSLDLNLKNIEEHVWRISDKPSTKAPLSDFIAKQLAWRFQVLDMSPELAKETQKELLAQLKLDPINDDLRMRAKAFATTESFRDVLTVLRTCNLQALCKGFDKRFGPEDAVSFDKSARPILDNLVTKINPLAYGPETPEGEPVYVALPSFRSPPAITVLAVYANTTRSLGTVPLDAPRLDPLIFEIDFTPPINQVVVNSPTPVYIHKYSTTTSSEILPDTFRQARSSFACWATGRHPTHNRVPDKFAVRWLSEQQTSRQKDGRLFGLFLIEEQKKWHRIRYLFSDNGGRFEINWTKHLPILRRLRKHELTINELLDMAEKVPEKDAQTFINVYEERPQGSLADKVFMEGIWVLKALYGERDRLAELPQSEMFEKPIRRFGASNQKHLVGFLRGSKFWYSRAHFLRPEAEEFLLNLNIFATVETIEGKRFLQCGITDGKSFEFLATVPVK